LTLEQLAAQGPGGNNHVVLTGFTPGEGCVAFYTDRRHRIIRLIEGEKPPPSRWELTEAPLFLGPDRRRVVAVVEAERVTTESEYESWRNRREIRGMITGKLVPDSKTGHALQELYPGVDLSNCYVLVEGRTPMSVHWTGIWLMSGMVLLLLAGTGLALRFLYRGS
jgi:hypothetical protein